jgi:hypothetical protein
VVSVDKVVVPPPKCTVTVKNTVAVEACKVSFPSAGVSSRTQAGVVVTRAGAKPWFPITLPKAPMSRMTASVSCWKSELSAIGHNDYLLEGVTNGFKIVDDDISPVGFLRENYKSASIENKAKVESQLNFEIECGRYVVCTGPPNIVSSIGAIPKPNSDVRIIHDLSRPGGGVNRFSSDNSVKFSTIHDATKLIKKGSFMAKIDLKSAYRCVPIHPLCHQFTGISWKFGDSQEVTYLYDARLPFGASKSCMVFQSISDSIVLMLARRNIQCLAYIDDFLLICDSKLECDRALMTILALVDSLGLDVNAEKTAGPTQKIVFLGIEVDAVSRTLTLPPKKLVEIKSLVENWSLKSRVTKKELQMFLGKLNWCTRVVSGGRTFLRNLINLLCKLKQSNHHIRLNTAAKSDINWWAVALVEFHGKTPFLNDVPVPSYYFGTDACTNGGGGHFGCDWFHVNWNLDVPELAEAHINVKELMSVFIAARIWSPYWYGRQIVVRSDNMAAVASINKSTSRSSDLLPIVKELFWLTIKYNFKLSAVFIPGKLNILADHLSRLDDIESAFQAKSLLLPAVNDVLLCKSRISLMTFLMLQEKWMRIIVH